MEHDLSSEVELAGTNSYAIGTTKSDPASTGLTAASASHESAHPDAVSRLETRHHEKFVRMKSTIFDHLNAAANTTSTTTDAERRQHRRDREFCTDACLIRYLRARDWKVKKASRLLLDTLEWRKSFGVDGRLDPATFSRDAETGKVYLHGFDAVRHPVLYMEPGRENTKNWDNGVKLLVHTMEKATRLMAPGVEQMVVVIDFTKYKLMEPPLPTSMEVNKIIGNHFPERLHRAYLVDPPFYFKIFWAAISPFVPEATKAKIRFVTGSMDAKKKLFNDDFPGGKGLIARYGGTDSFVYNHSEYWPVELKEFQERLAALNA